MMAVTAALLAGAGMVQYEVANAARPGAHSRHNLGYSVGRDYLGVGVAATTACGAVRRRNTADLLAYIARSTQGLPVIGYMERLSARQRLLERVMLGLRLRGGFRLPPAEVECQCRLEDIAGEAVAALGDAQLLEQHGEVLRLTATGYPLANQVVQRLMAAGEL